MPPKTRRKTSNASHPADAPVQKTGKQKVSVLANGTASTQQQCGAAAVVSEADYLLQHGVFSADAQPKTYTDLLLPILEYYVQHPAATGIERGVALPPRAAEEDDEEEERAGLAQRSARAHPSRPNGDGSSSSLFSPAVTFTTAAGVRARAKELAALVFPKAVAAHLESVPLLRPARQAESTSDRKRGRAGGDDDGGGDGKGEDGVDGTQAEKKGCATGHGKGAEDLQQQQRRLLALLGSAATTATYLGPYAGDSDYLRGEDVALVLSSWRSTASSFGFTATFLTLANRARFDLFMQIVPCVQAVMDVFLAQSQHRLRAMVETPRVLRVGRRLRMSPQEIATLTFLLLCHSGSLLAASASFALTLTTLAYYNRLTPQESMEFVSSHRLHVKQGLVTSDTQSRNSFAESRYSMPQEAVTALTGNELNEEQLIKLERTALADVLVEEKDRKRKEAARIAAAAVTAVEEEPSMRTGTNTPGSVSDDDGTEDGGGDDDGEDGDVVVDASTVHDVLAKLGVDAGSLPRCHTVESIQATLQQQLSGGGAKHRPREEEAEADGTHQSQQRQQHQVSDAAVVMDAGQQQQQQGGDGQSTPTTAEAVAVSDPPSHMHQPYCTDFEYMEEAFKMFVSLIKLRSAEGDMKDEDDAYTPRTKIEATMRELRGKVRVTRAIHSHRVAATLAVAGQSITAPPTTATTTTTTHRKTEEAENNGEGEEGEEGGKEKKETVLLTVDSNRLGDNKGAFLPRIEQLARRLHLCEMEKHIILLLVGGVVSQDILVAINGRYVMRDGQQRYLTVGYLLFVLCEGLQERIAARRFFYQSSPLITHGILSLGLDGSGTSRSCFNTDLMDYVCDVDRKIVDYLMGSETETSEMVPGSSLYHPTVQMDNVVLPAQTTKLVLSTIEHYDMFEKCKKTCGFGDGLGTTASGLAILFYGPSGTGKTMLANAVAHELKKRLLLVNVSQFKAERRAPEMMRFIFREAKLNDAIIFFDECESLFETRETNPLVTSVLTEFEKNDGLVIMATNMAQVMDEAMNRRISLMVEFKLPSHPMRQSIWQRHMPKSIALAPDVSLEKLALNYELSGGLIRNAVLAALNRAIARENTHTPTLCMEDLVDGAKLQLRGFFLAAARPGGAGAGAGGGGGGGGGLSHGSGGCGGIAGSHAGSETYLTPRRTLAELVMDPVAKRKLEAIPRLAKSRSTLFSQWGFTEESCQDQGCMYLLSGPSGTGKSLAAEGIAYECGATIRLCNVSELLLLSELNIAAVFEEGRRLGALIVFDEAQELFTHSERGQHISQLIQYYAVRYPKPVIVIATVGSSGAGAGRISASASAVLVDSLDIHASRFTFAKHVVFRFPDQALRRQLWRGAFPDKVPLAHDVDFEKLSERRVSAKLIRRVVFTVCCRAAAEGEAARVTMAKVEEELSQCILAEEQRNPARGMFV